MKKETKNDDDDEDEENNNVNAQIEQIVVNK
jgi:hypothetical protein